MATTLLVPLDGSDKDPRALAVAVAAADLTRGLIELVRVLPPDAGAEARAAADRELSATAQPLAAGGTSATWRVLEGEDVADALRAYADARGAGLLVVATRAPGGLERLRGGSVGDRLVREGRRPVLLAPPPTNYAAGLHIRLQRVLVALDGSPQARAALDTLVDLTHPADASLVLVEVVPPAEPWPPGGPAVPAAADNRHRAPAERRLAEAAARPLERGFHVETYVAESPYPVEAISAGVRDHLVDAIALGTRGRGGLARLVLGSVATGVVARSEVPVLLVAGDAAGA